MIIRECFYHMMWYQPHNYYYSVSRNESYRLNISNHIIGLAPLPEPLHLLEADLSLHKTGQLRRNVVTLVEQALSNGMWIIDSL